MTLEEAVSDLLHDYARDGFDELDAASGLAKCVERYGIAMHDRGNSHRKPWGYVPEDSQEKARHAAVAAFQGGDG